MMKGYIRKVESDEEREWYRYAQLASWLLQPHLKKGKTITADQLLNKTKEEKDKKTTKEESEKEIISLFEELGEGLSLE